MLSVALTRMAGAARSPNEALCSANGRSRDPAPSGRPRIPSLAHRWERESGDGEKGAHMGHWAPRPHAASGPRHHDYGLCCRLLRGTQGGVPRDGVGGRAGVHHVPVPVCPAHVSASSLLHLLLWQVGSDQLHLQNLRRHNSPLLPHPVSLFICPYLSIDGQ